MPHDHKLSPGAALAAVATAFVVGMLATLAIRPPGEIVQQNSTDAKETAREQVRWRLFQEVVDGREHFEAACLEQALAHAGSCIDHDFVIPGLDQDGGTVTIMRRTRRAGPEESQLDLIAVARGEGGWH